MLRRHLTRTLMLLTMGLFAAPALADEPAAGYPPSEPIEVPRYAHPVPEPVERGPQRSGFTIMLGLGVGYQANASDLTDEEINQVALAGLNLGIGAFVMNELAIMLRSSSTFAFLDEGAFNDVTSSSGVVTGAVQVWPVDRLRLEAGLGFGYHSVDLYLDDLRISRDQYGFGLLLSVGAAFWQNRHHSLQLGLDYAPAFVEEDGPVHNLGFTFGWQMF